MFLLCIYGCGRTTYRYVLFLPDEADQNVVSKSCKNGVQSLQALLPSIANANENYFQINLFLKKDYYYDSDSTILKGEKYIISANSHNTLSVNSMRPGYFIKIPLFFPTTNDVDIVNMAYANESCSLDMHGYIQ